MGMLDGISKAFSGGDLWTALIPSIMGAVSSAYDGSAESDRSALARQDALNIRAEDLVFNREKLAQDKELAMAALAARGDGGSGAALAAARLTDARERQRMKMEAQASGLSARLKAIEFLSPATLASAGNARTQAALQGSDNVAAAYRAAGQMINPAFRVPMPTFG